MIRTLFAALATTVFTFGVVADDSYHNLSKGNPDLFGAQVTEGSVIAVQPGVGDNLNRYHGLDEGNPDLFRTNRGSWAQSDSDNPDIYNGFGGGPDTSY